MTTPGRPGRAATGRRRRGVLVAAGAWVAALGVLGVSACGDDGEPASGRSGGATSSTTATSSSSASAPGRAADATDMAGTEPGVPGEVRGPVPLDAPADVGNGVEVRLSRIEAVEAEAHLPGEISGPAVAITVEIANGSGRAIGLDHVTVDLAAAGGASASPVLDPDRAPLAGDLDAGGTRSGSYVFTLGEDEREDVSVRIRYSTDAPTFVFAGSAPRA